MDYINESINNNKISKDKKSDNKASNKKESTNASSILNNSNSNNNNSCNDFLGGKQCYIDKFITDNKAYIQDADKRKLNGISIKPIDKGYLKLKYIDTESNIDVEVKLDFKQDKTKDYLKTFNLCGDLSFISNNFTIYQYSSSTDKSLGFTLLIDDTGKKFIWGYEQMRCSGIYSLN